MYILSKIMELTNDYRIIRRKFDLHPNFSYLRIEIPLLNGLSTFLLGDGHALMFYVPRSRIYVHIYIDRQIASSRTIIPVE